MLRSAVCILSFVLAAVARAQESPPPTGAPRPPLQLEIPSQPQHPPLPAAIFGQPGHDWLTLGPAAQDDFNESTDFNFHVSWSTFLVQDVEFGVEGAAWYFDQEQDAAVGVGVTPYLRWHLVSRPTWSLFTDAGVGLLLASDDVPDEGTSFNFAPRAGFGATFQVADDGTRLEIGLRWSHISNARITGDAANPGRDAPQLYFGVMIPL